MANLNKVMLIGNLTRDPELRHTPKGFAVSNLGLAVNRRVQDGNGGWKDEVAFVDVTIWGSSAENAQKYLTKGRSVFIEGHLQMDVWDDKTTGQKRSKLTVVADNLQYLSESKGGSTRQFSENPSNDQEGGTSQHQDGGSRQGGSAAPADDYQEEDDIPF